MSEETSMLQKQDLVRIVATLTATSLLATSARADNEKGTAIIKGRVVLEGDRPRPKAIKMTGDLVCTKAHGGKKKPDQGTIVFKDNSIPYVFVYVKKGVQGKYDPPSEPVVLDQKGCQYRPHVFGLVAGQPLHIRNSDPTSHNVHALPKKNTEFNFSQPSQGMVKELTGRQTFTRPEVMVRFKCDVHNWMEAFCGVLAHPFFSVTGKGGAFEIKDLPAGQYVIEAWHETFGTTTQTVTVAEGETKQIELRLTGGQKKTAAAPVKRTITLASPAE